MIATEGHTLSDPHKIPNTLSAHRCVFIYVVDDVQCTIPKLPGYSSEVDRLMLCCSQK